jgi:type IV pilus assembly protein PilM
MPPRIPNPKITLPKPKLPARGAKGDAGAPADAAPTPDKAVKAKKGRPSLGGPTLSLPKLSAPKLSARSAPKLPKLGGKPKAATGAEGASEPKAAKPAKPAKAAKAPKPPKAPRLSRSRQSGDVVGLDIEPGYVVAAQAKQNGMVQVTKAVGMPLDLEVVRDGEVLDPQALGQALAELFRGSGLGRNVRVGLANQRTVLRTLDLPPIEDAKELAAAVRFQAEEEVPMPLNNAVLDFQPLGLVDTPNGQRQRVVLVAAQRDMVDRLLEALKIAGLRPVGVDLSAFALIRSLYERGGERGPNLVYLGVGGLTNMAIADGITCKFTRVLSGGLESMAEDLAARREITVTQARDLLFNVGLPAEDDPPATLVAPAGAFPEATAPDQGYGDAHAHDEQPTDVYPAAPAPEAYDEQPVPLQPPPTGEAYSAPAPEGYDEEPAPLQPPPTGEAHPAEAAPAYDEQAAYADEAATEAYAAPAPAEQVDEGGEDEEVHFFFGQADDAGVAPAPTEEPPAEPAYRAPVDDYEEPAPFTDDYVFQPEAEQAPYAAAPEQPHYEEPAPHSEQPTHYEEPAPYEEPAQYEEPAPYAEAAPEPTHAPSYRAGDPNEDVHTVIADGVREIAGEVRNSLDFQRIQGGGEAVQGIVLSGPVLDVPGFAEALERELALPLYRGTVAADSGAMGGLVTGSRLAVAAGLSIEEVPR